jgi:transcription antitermination factor NusG
MEKNWLAIYTKPRAEKKVEERLLKNGIEAYCPTFTTLKQWSDRKKKIELPLIPSYVFVRVNELERAKVLQDPGAMNFIFWQGKVALVREEEILALKHINHSLENVDHKIGETIQITHGAFQGQEGEVVNKTKNTITVYLNSLQMRLVVKSEN